MDFQVGVKNDNEVLFYVTLCFQKKIRQVILQHNNDSFVRLPVSCAQCIFGEEKNPGPGKKLNQADDFFSHVYEESVSSFTFLTGDIILSLHTTQNGFRSDNG